MNSWVGYTPTAQGQTQPQLQRCKGGHANHFTRRNNNALRLSYLSGQFNVPISLRDMPIQYSERELIPVAKVRISPQFEISSQETMNKILHFHNSHFVKSFS